VWPTGAHVLGPIAVLDPSRMHHHHQKETEHIHDDVALAPPRALPPVIAADPPFSVVFTVWLSMIPALGSRFLSWPREESPRRVSCIRSTPRRMPVPQ